MNRNHTWRIRVKAPLISRLSASVQTVKAWPCDPLVASYVQGIEARGDGKVTTGITGLWRPSVHSDVAFRSFDVGSSQPRQAELSKGWIVHPLNSVGGKSRGVYSYASISG